MDGMKGLAFIPDLHKCIILESGVANLWGGGRRGCPSIRHEQILASLWPLASPPTQTPAIAMEERCRHDPILTVWFGEQLPLQWTGSRPASSRKLVHMPCLRLSTLGDQLEALLQSHLVIVTLFIVTAFWDTNLLFPMQSFFSRVTPSL